MVLACDSLRHLSYALLQSHHVDGATVEGFSEHGVMYGSDHGFGMLDGIDGLLDYLPFRLCGNQGVIVVCCVDGAPCYQCLSHGVEVVAVVEEDEAEWLRHVIAQQASGLAQLVDRQFRAVVVIFESGEVCVEFLASFGRVGIPLQCGFEYASSLLVGQLYAAMLLHALKMEKQIGCPHKQLHEMPQLLLGHHTVELCRFDIPLEQLLHLRHCHRDIVKHRFFLVHLVKHRQQFRHARTHHRPAMVFYAAGGA